MDLYRGDANTLGEMDIAKNVAETLHKHYPGHLWAVAIQNGAIVIKNLRISHTHGMVVHLDKYYADPSNRMIVMFAGELLERAHLRRGKDRGDDANILEGAQEKYQPSNGLIR